MADSNNIQLCSIKIKYDNRKKVAIPAWVIAEWDNYKVYSKFPNLAIVSRWTPMQQKEIFKIILNLETMKDNESKKVMMRDDKLRRAGHGNKSK